jgi:hypothetical protein
MDAHADRSDRLDAMGLLGGHDAELALRKLLFTRKRRLDHITKSALEHLDAPPNAAFRGVISSQTIRNRLGIVDLRLAIANKVLGQLESRAEHAFDFEAELFFATLFAERPRTVGKRWQVAHVTLVSTAELGDPVLLVVLMKAYDFALHEQKIAQHGDALVFF